MIKVKKINDLNDKILNFLYFIFPITFLIGNGANNITVLLVVLLGMINYSYNIIFFKDKNVFYLILSFFLLLGLSTILEINGDIKNEQFIKFIKYFRFFLFFLVTSFFIQIGKFSFKYFLISTSLCVLFLSLDIIFQLINGFDVFGYEAYKNSKYHLSGFLGDELNAGGFIQKFSLFCIIFLPLFFNYKGKKNSVVTIIFIITIFSGIFYSGNRMPLVMFIFSLLLISIIEKHLRFKILVSISLCGLIFFASLKTQENMRMYYKSFYQNSLWVITSISNYAFKEYPELKEGNNFVGTLFKPDGEVDEERKSKYENVSFGSGHLIVYSTALDVWSDNPVIGSGIKSFRKNCQGKLHLPNRVCQSHPHNYYLELLTDTGIAGLFIFLFFVLIIMRDNFIKIKILNYRDKLLLITITIILIAEIFPIKSSGSFFSTYNSAYLFFMLAMLNGIKNNSLIKKGFK